MIRLVLVILAVFGVSGCLVPSAPVPDEPSLPVVFGARVTDGQLRLWTGTPCRRVEQVMVRFSPGPGGRLQLTAPPDRATEFEFLTLDGPYPGGLAVTEPLADGFDWRAAKTVSLTVEPSEGAGTTAADIAEIVDGSAQHPDDSYYFEGVGWLNPEQVTEQNGKSLLTICTTDPASEPELPATFGARVTDGTLEIATGTPCAETNGVSLFFRPTDPNRSDIQLRMFVPHGSPPVDFDRLRLGEIPPGMRIDRPLPDGFDWHSMESVQLSIHRPDYHRDTRVDLAEVIRGSAEHPADMYYFQGAGWLDLAQAAEQDGKTYLSACRE
ncbi:hypothetical protein SAMN04489835_2077 [Mycolicibacterium rutilum]|uniref:Lipoprotein n=1 Tax=Mycolicibacterium rutilum TaxID=370526 RepID=A0A1H6JRT7_MYCRU|nr:hypothetical protein [Mycolicibacterium rutilum]SEH61791.1 hypothetical protein SAMN04489835_2077 [Mycolicibacterium rutilum]